MSDEQAQQPLDVYAVIALMLDQLADIAWQKMGYRPDPITSKIETDWAQAKVAIDTCDLLASKVESVLEDEDLRNVKNLMRDLKTNYMNRSGQ